MAVIASYLWWQYQSGLEEIYRAWMNIHWFLYNFFSIPLLAKSFFAPFRRMQEKKDRGFVPENIAEVFVINVIMRFVGMLVLTVIIAVGLVAETVLLVIGATVFILAFGAPFFIPGLIGVGLAMLLL